MKDKDKLILLFNIDVSGINEDEVNDFLFKSVKAFTGYFDDSVKCIFTATKQKDKQTVQAVTDFPIEGVSIIEKLNEYYKNGEKEKFEEQLDVLNKFAEEFKKNGK